MSGKGPDASISSALVTPRATTSWSDGRFLCWGSGKHSQHCHGVGTDINFSQSEVEHFTPTNRETWVKVMACGSSHTIVVTKSNDIYVWGNNHCGQLGCGDEENRKIPTKIELYALQRENPDIKGVACGGRHTFVWLDNGNVFSFGNNTFAQLAYDFRIKNYRENQKKPHLIRTISHKNVQQIACGEKHTTLLFKGGHVSTIGAGSLGQLGNNSRNEAVVPVNLEDLPPVKFIAAGAFHNVVIDVTGEIWCWGFGPACGKSKEEGDLLKPERYPTRHPNIVQVTCGHSHNAALSANGSVYTWGQGVDGQLGLGPNITLIDVPTKLPFPVLKVRTAEIACGENYTTSVSESGQLYIWGKNSYVINTEVMSNVKFNSPQLVNTLKTPVEKVTCGAWHLAAITGKPTWRKEDDLSDIEDGDITSEGNQDEVDSCDMEIEALPREDTTLTRPGFSREKTTISLADFYAPSPSPTHGKSPSPDIMTGRKKLPSYLEPKKHTKAYFTQKNQVVWKATVHQNQHVQLGTIEQSPNSPKKESLDMKITRLETSSPRYAMPSLVTDLHSLDNNSDSDNIKNTKIILPRLEKPETNGVSVTDLRTIARRSTPSSQYSGDSTSTRSYKTYKTHKSQAAIQLHANMTVEPHTHHIEGNIPQSNYVHARQLSPPKLPSKISKQLPSKYTNCCSVVASKQKRQVSNNKYFSGNPTPTQLYKFGAPTPRVFISSTRLNFVSPEPLQEPSHLGPRTVRRQRYMNTSSRNAISQPINLEREDTNMYIPNRYKGRGYSRNESEQSSYSGIDVLMQTSQDIFNRTNLRKLSNAPSIALQRRQAKHRIDKSNTRFTNPIYKVVPPNTFPTEDDRNVKRSYALPQRINFMAKDLIKRHGNYCNPLHNGPVTPLHLENTNEKRNRILGKKDSCNNKVHSLGSNQSVHKRGDLTVGIINTTRVS